MLTEKCRTAVHHQEGGDHRGGDRQPDDEVCRAGCAGRGKTISTASSAPSSSDLYRRRPAQSLMKDGLVVGQRDFVHPRSTAAPDVRALLTFQRSFPILPSRGNLCPVNFPEFLAQPRRRPSRCWRRIVSAPPRETLEPLSPGRIGPCRVKASAFLHRVDDAGDVADGQVRDCEALARRTSRIFVRIESNSPITRTA